MAKSFACHSAPLAIGLLIQAVAIGLLTACSGLNSPATEDSLLRSEVSDMLGESAAEAGTAGRKFGLAQSDKHDDELSEFSREQLTSQLEKKVSFEWSGPASGAARRIAEDIGYSFSVAGNPPSIEPVIHLLLENASVVHVLQQIGIRSHPVAEVIVDPNESRVDFRFVQSRIGTVVK